MKIILAISLMLALSACSLDTDSATTDKQVSPSLKKQEMQSMSKNQADKKSSQLFEFRGTVKFVTLEGGFYAIHADDGRKFSPQNLVAAHRKHGLVVQVKGKVLEDVITFQQYGKVLHITSIEVLDDSNVGRGALM